MTAVRGGQNWEALVDKMLCHTCYALYRARGYLDRVLAKKPKKGKVGDKGVNGGNEQAGGNET